jgi:pimeloyl-ACP methyl ester carboxylesterase
MSNLSQDRPRTALVALAAASAAAAGIAAWVHASARRAEREHWAPGRYLHIDGVRLHYVMRGEGPPVVLLHGNIVTQADFQASGLMDQLARRHQVVAFDRPGFGHSSRPRDRLWTAKAQAELLRGALAGLGIRKPVIVGHSMGTMVALAMALDFPDEVAGLVLIGGYYYPKLRVDALLTAPVALPLLGDVMRYTVTALSARAMLNRMVKGMFAPCEVPPGFFTVIPRELMLRPLQLRANAEDAAFMMPEARSLSRRYFDLRIPVTLIAGSQDKAVDPWAHSQRFHEEYPQSRFQLVPGVGHMAHYGAPDLVCAAVDGLGIGRPAAADVLQESREAEARPEQPVRDSP